MTATATIAAEMPRGPRTARVSRVARREFDEQVRQAAAIEAEQLRQEIEELHVQLRRLEEWMGRTER